MSNIFEKIGHGIEVGAVDVAKVVVDVPEFLIKAEKVISSAIKDQPKIKAAVLELVKQAEAVVGDVAGVSAEKGLNLKDDSKALSDAEAFFEYFKNTFIPLVESVYKEVAADLK